MTRRIESRISQLEMRRPTARTVFVWAETADEALPGYVREEDFVIRFVWTDMVDGDGDEDDFDTYQ